MKKADTIKRAQGKPKALPRKPATPPMMYHSILVLLAITNCNGFNSMKDGYYTAETSEYPHGWKEYLRIQVKNRNRC